MLEFLNKNLFGVAVPVTLIIAGVFFAFLLKFFHIFRVWDILKVFFKKSEGDGISPFRAVTLALAGTLGVGNIVGVATAITLGGFGSIFWMWVSALCAMLLKYAEIVLAMRHRRYEKDGNPYGAAMYYIKDCFAERSHKKLGASLAALFALLCIVNALTMGNMIQSNAVAEALEGVFDISPLLCGALLAILGALIITRGTELMAKFTEILVPLMTLGYVVISLWVLIVRRDMLGEAFSSIFKDAFSPDSAAGGFLGFLFSRALRFGTMRGLVSNEAGCGTAPAAHATSCAKSPVEQGFWGIFEVFVDTIILCTMTALVIIVSFGDLRYRGSYIMLTLDAYSSVLGEGAAIFLSLAVLCFGFATIVCWAHYGIESVRYFTRGKAVNRIFIAVYSVCAMIGANVNSSAIWSTADFAIGAMTLINVAVLLLMRKEIKLETEEYFYSTKKEKIFQKGVDKP